MTARRQPFGRPSRAGNRMAGRCQRTPENAIQGRDWPLLQTVQKKHPLKCAGVAGRRVRASAPEYQGFNEPRIC